MENKNSNTGLKVLAGILVALLIVTGFYAVNLYRDKKNTESQLTQEKETVMKNLNLMAKKYDVAIGESRVTNEHLVDARDRIKGLLDSLNHAETDVKSLWRFKKRYLDLQKEMDLLLMQNDELKIENQLLESTLDSTQVQLEERAVFTDSLLVQNKALANVVEDAAVLGTVGLKGFGVIERTSGKLIPTERAKRSDKVRICFTVVRNTLVQAGDKELFVQVIDPNNNVLGVNSQVQFEDKTLNYSAISKFNYENANLDICEFVAHKDGREFEKGRYTVNVFNESDLVSNAEFTLK